VDFKIEIGGPAHEGPEYEESVEMSDVVVIKSEMMNKIDLMIFEVKKYERKISE
jgi:hypothetical protein